MRRDILLGMILAAVLHFSAALYSHITRDPAHPHRAAIKDEPVAVLQLPEEILEIENPDIDQPLPKTPPPISRDLIQQPDEKEWVIPTEAPRPHFAGDPGMIIPADFGTTSFPQGPYRIVDVDRAPQAVLQVAPVYPAAMKAQHVEGRVVVQFVVDASNTVRDVRAISSSDRA